MKKGTYTILIFSIMTNWPYSGPLNADFLNMKSSQISRVKGICKFEPLIGTKVLQEAQGLYAELFPFVYVF